MSGEAGPVFGKPYYPLNLSYQKSCAKKDGINPDSLEQPQSVDLLAGKTQVKPKSKQIPVVAGKPSEVHGSLAAHVAFGMLQGAATGVTLGLVSCAEAPSDNYDCGSEPVLTSKKLRLAVKSANMMMHAGKVYFSVSVNFPEDLSEADRQAVADELKTGKVSLRISSQNGVIGSDEEGKLTVSSYELAPCESKVVSCSPYNSIDGFVPVGFAKVVKLPDTVIPDSSEAEQYAVGKKMLQSASGDPIIAVYDRVLASKVIGQDTEGQDIVEKIPVFECQGKRVIEDKSCTSENADECASVEPRYYEVVDGAVTEAEILCKASDLAPAFAYYRVDSLGKYLPNGVPVEDPNLMNVDFDVMVDDSVSFQTFAENNDIEALALPLDVTALVTDKSNPSRGENTCSDSELSGDEGCEIPAAFHSKGEMRLNIALTATSSGLFDPTLAYNTALNAELLIDIPKVCKAGR